VSIVEISEGPTKRRPAARRPTVKWLTIVALLVPALVLYLTFVILPIFQGAYYSLFKWNGLQPLDNFIGLGNYQKALGSPIFTGAVYHNIVIVVLSLTVQIPFALLLATFLNQRFPGRTIFRIIFFLPYVISEVVTGIVFYLLLQPDGAANSALKAGGASSLSREWWSDISNTVAVGLGPVAINVSLVMLTLFVVISWKYFGFHMILLLAGLQGIPRELEEAARIDGCGRWQVFRYVTLPLLGPTLRVSIFLSIIGALQLFDIIYATTRGGPVHSSDTIAYYMFDFGFKRQQMGYGSAVAVLLFLMCFVFALGYQRYVLRRDTEGALTSLGE
jgi:raffinose/stachyose/melibiose transport system permease protein